MTAAACVAVPGLPLLAHLWMRCVGRSRLLRATRCPAPVDTVIVPGCAVRPDGTPSTLLEDRLATALSLYREGSAARILVSGDAAHRLGNEASAMRGWLLQRDVPASDLLIDGASRRTRETMQRAARELGQRRVALCTQRFHLPRALFLARHAGLDAQGVVADRRAYRSAVALQLRELAAETTALVESWVL